MLIPTAQTLPCLLQTAPSGRVNERRFQRGFTLVELLVAIAIIAVLAALLFPVFARGREKGRQTTCLSNLKQLGMGTLLYVQDYDECIYPYEYNGPSGPGDRITWKYYTDYDTTHPNDYSRGLLYPYVKSTGVFTCPDAVSFATTVGGGSGSYGLNPYLQGARINGTETVGIVLATAQAHTETILIADTAKAFEGKLRSNDVLDSPANGSVIHGRHNGMADVVWLDGHVKAMRPVCGRIDLSVCLIDKFDLGTLLRKPYSGNKRQDDYYWELVKPD